MDFVAEDRPADVSLGRRVENRELKTSFASSMSPSSANSSCACLASSSSVMFVVFMSLTVVFLLGALIVLVVMCCVVCCVCVNINLLLWEENARYDQRMNSVRY